MNNEYAHITQGRYIAVAASLTGGNALATFVRMIQLWCMELGCSVPQVSDQSNLIMSATLSGEDLDHGPVRRDEGGGGAEPGHPPHHLRGAALPRPEGLSHQHQSGDSQ